MSQLRSLFAVLLLTPAFALSDNPKDVKAEIVMIDGKRAFIYAAPQPARGSQDKQGKPWIWYAPTINGSVLIEKKRYYFNAFIKAGITVAGFDLGEVRGSPKSCAKFSRFYDTMVARGYSAKPILLGQSRGGMMTLAWAVRNPDKVRAWVGIYPVCNLTSWPMKSSRRETLADFGMTEEQLRSRLTEFNPIDNLAGLAREKVPMFSVHGDNDAVVPYNENSKPLAERYQAAGGSCQVKIIPGGRHAETPEYFECRELLEFVLKHARP